MFTGIRQGARDIFAFAKNKHVTGKLEGEMDVINEHLSWLGGAGGHGDPNDPRNRDKWKGDIRRHLNEMRKYVDRLTGERNRAPWLDEIKRVEQQLRNMR